MFGEHIFGSLNTVFASMQTQRWRSIGIVTPEETTYNKLNSNLTITLEFSCSISTLFTCLIQHCGAVSHKIQI